MISLKDITIPLRIVLTAYCFFQFAVQVLWLSKWAMPKIIKGAQHNDEKRKLALETAQKHVKFYLKTLSFFRLVDFNFIGNPMTTAGVIAGNHPSILDFIVLLVDFPNAVCIYKSQTNSNPILADFVKTAQYIEGMDGSSGSSKRIINNCCSSLKKQYQIVVFPEGTRSKTALSPQRFRTTLFHAAAQLQLPVQPVAIYCDPLFLGKNQSWIEFSSAKNNMTISYLDPVSISDLPAEEQTARGLALHTRKLIKEELKRLDSLKKE